MSDDKKHFDNEQKMRRAEQMNRARKKYNAQFHKTRKRISGTMGNEVCRVGAPGKGSRPRGLDTNPR